MKFLLLLLILLTGCCNCHHHCCLECEHTNVHRQVIVEDQVRESNYIKIEE